MAGELAEAGHISWRKLGFSAFVVILGAVIELFETSFAVPGQIG